MKKTAIHEVAAAETEAKPRTRRPRMQAASQYAKAMDWTAAIAVRMKKLQDELVVLESDRKEAIASAAAARELLDAAP